MSNFIAPTGGNGGNFAQPPIAQNLHAACFAIASLGDAPQKQFGTDQEVMVPTVFLGFTFGKDDEGREMTLWKRYRFSYNERASLRKDLEMWRDRDFTDEEIKKFPLTNVLGKKCTICTDTTAGGNPKITKIKPERDGNEVEVENPFVYDHDDPKQEHFDELPKFVQDLVQKPAEEESNINFGEMPF